MCVFLLQIVESDKRYLETYSLAGKTICRLMLNRMKNKVDTTFTKTKVELGKTDHVYSACVTLNRVKNEDHYCI